MSEKIKNNKRNVIIIIAIAVIAILVGLGFYKYNKTVANNVLNETKNNICTYKMTQNEIKSLPSTQIKEQTIEDEQKISQEQAVEGEAFELQGEVAYNGTTQFGNITLGNYQGLTYYSQLDSRWKDNLYTITGNASQTIGSSGCGPASAAMIVTATKGTITPNTMSDLFIQNGFRSTNNGTYLSAFRWVADTFNIGYEETYYLDRAVQLLNNNNYVVVSVGNGLFTTGGHLMVIVGVDGNTLKIYDPYLYAGKFDTSTRRGKVNVQGNVVYCSIENFRNYANYTKFFAYSHDGNVQENNADVVTSEYSRYVTAKIGLNIRNNPNGTIVGAIPYGTRVNVYETNGNWSRIDGGWVSSSYLSGQSGVSTGNSITNSYSTGTYKVNASVLNVRTGAGTNYRNKTYNELTANARNQNRSLGNYYTNGYKKGVVCTVTSVSGNWGKTASGWISLDYCNKM